MYIMATCLSLIEIAHKFFAFLNCSKYPDIEEGEKHHGQDIEEDDNFQHYNAVVIFGDSACIRLSITSNY